MNLEFGMEDKMHDAKKLGVESLKTELRLQGERYSLCFDNTLETVP